MRDNKPLGKGGPTHPATCKAFVARYTPAAVIQVTSETLGASKAFPTKLHWLPGGGSLLVTTDKFVSLPLSFRCQTGKNGGPKVNLATRLFSEGESVP